MITLNSRYIKDVNFAAEELEKLGFIVAVEDKEDVCYEYDRTREHKQNLSPHDWHTDAEYWAMYKFIK